VPRGEKAYVVKLSEYLDILSYDVAFWLTAFRNPDYPPAQLGDVCVQVTAKLRTAAIIALLTKGSSDSFHHNLIRSARCRIAYLERLRQEGILDDHHQGSGRIDPFLDSVAAADFGSARQIVQLSLREWLEGHEYEEDFCYAQIVHGLITVPTDLSRLELLFDRFEVASEGRKDARLDVCRAIARRDQHAFDEAFDGLIAERAKHIEAERARNRIEEPTMMAERQVYVEGLALLQIAGRLRFSTEAEYAFCPSIARAPMRTPFPGE
jgi:Immunity protein 49